MDVNFEENPENLIIPLELSKIIINYDPKDANLAILDKKDQIYGKALDGDGNINFKNGNKYSGELHNGMLHGKGKFNWTNGVVYEGDFYYNAIQGKGKYTWPDGSIYEGDVVGGLRDGFGKFVSPNEEAIYEGEWKDGRRQGKGKLTFKSGAIYEGEFFEGYKQGQGTMTYPSKNTYEGQWKKDKKEGYGTMNWYDTMEKYYGNWENNKQNGFGVHIWLEQKGEGKLLRNRYQGQWKDGQRNGYGTFFYANGSKYEGEWKNNLKDGFAIFTEDNGNIIQCQFKADRMMKEEDAKLKVPELSPIKDSSRNEKSPNLGNKKGSNQSSQLNSKNQMKKTNQGQFRVGDQKVDSIQQQQTQQQQQLDKQIQEQGLQIQKKKEIEPNPFILLVDFNDLTENVNDDVQRIQRDAQNMLLRHNSQLKQWYKVYSTKFDNCLGEDAFSMDLLTYWKFIKEAKVCDSEVTLAAINRLFYKGAKNNFSMQIEEKELETKINLIKKIGRQLTPQELNEVDLIDLVLSNQLKDKLNWGEIQSEQQSNEVSSQKQVQDVHSGNKIILFRHFVELIVRTSYLKYGNINELHRSIENLIELKLKPQFQRPLSSTSEKSSQVETKNYGSQLQKELNQLFQIHSRNIKSAKFGQIDKTIKIKNIMNILKKSNLLENDQILLTMLEKSFDQESLVSYVDQLQKDDQLNWKKRMQKVKDKKAQQQQYVPSQNFEKMKAERIAKLYDTELIYYEFQDLLVNYLIKHLKDKEQVNIKKEEEVVKKLRPFIESMVKIDCYKDKSNKTPRLWPISEKDQQKDQLAQLRIKQKEEFQERKRKEEERKREQIEKARMQLEELERKKMESEDVDVGMQSDSDNQSEEEKKKIKRKNFNKK